MTYYLEFNNDDGPVGDLVGYDTLDEAKAAALQLCDIGVVRVMKVVATVCTLPDGSSIVEDIP